MFGKVALTGFAAAMLMATSAQAALFVVDAKNNSSSGGTGLASISLSAGETFSVSVNPGDLWNAGALPRWSNANGLTGNLFATGSDDSGQIAGTLIGVAFPLHTQSGLTAPFGSLVGELGGVFKVLGTSFNGAAWNAGTLKLYYWDSNNGDNTQFITADVNRVPEPGSMILLVLSALSAFAASIWRRAA